MENFYEQLITTYKTGIYKVVEVLFYLFGVMALITLSINLVFFIIFLLLGIGMLFLKRNLYVEYEYVFTNGEIDIDKIVEMKKRSHVFSFDIKNTELLAAEDSDYVKDFSNKPSKVLNLFPKTTDKKIYVAMITGGNERVQVRFVPDEEFVNLCYKYNPRAVKKY
ncbi:hypothetical protein SAMN05428976_106150 [Clostridium sp. USBA 49]|jgi:hypothetical protein|uniref:hypothetical protein n=1 Tax=Clostridium TaxID=1485 RepID=UPI000999B8E2|nr:MULTISPECIES: hypothetical protein [Clostridium]SKA84276.1 hypothetical protein SAMN05428976_106150 [Clostridium sp. USBA 49]